MNNIAIKQSSSLAILVIDFAAANPLKAAAFFNLKELM